MKLLKLDNIENPTDNITDTSPDLGATKWTVGTEYHRGDYVYYDEDHIIYRVLEDITSQCNIPPPEDDRYDYIKPLNKYAWRDVQVSTQSEQDDLIQVEGHITNTTYICLYNVIADTITITFNNGSDTTTITKSVTHHVSFGFYDYFYGGYWRTSKNHTIEVPVGYETSDVTIKVEKPSDRVYVGKINTGTENYLGATVEFPKLNGESYSKKEFTTTGLPIMKRGVNTKNMNVSTKLRLSEVDVVIELIESVDGTLSYFVQDSGFLTAIDSMDVLGWVEDWSIVPLNDEIFRLDMVIQGVT